MRKNKILVVGYFHEIIELCNRCNVPIYGVISKKNSIKENFNDIMVIGNDADAKKLVIEQKNLALILTPDMPVARYKLYKYYKSLGFRFISIVDPNADISSSASIGNGTIVQKGAVVSCSTIVGDFVKINVRANITHDCRIGAFTTVAPDAVVLGYVKIGKMCYIGANSTILPNVEIGNNVVIGAGAVVTKSVKSDVIVKGNPAK